MIALIGAFGRFHFAQQRVHFINRQSTIGTHGAVACECREQFVPMLGEHARAAIFAHVTQARRASVRAPSALREQGGTPRSATCVGEASETSSPSCSSSSPCSVAVAMSTAVAREHLRDQQTLLRNLPLIKLALQFFVHDALVRCVHVDDDQATLVLRQNIDARQLRHCESSGTSAASSLGLMADGAGRSASSAR